MNLATYLILLVLGSFNVAALTYVATRIAALGCVG